MALDRRKFNEKTFVQHVPIDLFKEFMEPYRGKTNGLDMEHLTEASLYDYLVDSGDACPPEMIEALHRMNDVLGQDNYDRIIDLAKQKNVLGKMLNGNPEPPLAELIMRSYLYARIEVFDLLWDEEFLHSLDLPYDRVAQEARPIKVTKDKLTAFTKAIQKLYKDNLQGDLCKIRHYDDEDGVYFVIRHGWRYERLTVAENGSEKVIGIRPVKPDVIHYNPDTGKIQMKTTTKKMEEQDELRDLFAEHMLGDADLFRHDEADQLYTLAPLRRDGVDFKFSEGLLEGDSVKLVAVKVASGEDSKRTVTTVENKQDALAEIAAHHPKINLARMNC